MENALCVHMWFSKRLHATVSSVKGWLERTPGMEANDPGLTKYVYLHVGLSCLSITCITVMPH